MCFLKTYTSSLFSCKTSFVKSLMSIVNDLIPLNDVPQHLLLIARDIAWFRQGEFTQVEEEAPNKHFPKVTFHNKRIEMINLSSILHCKQVRMAIPDFIEDREPPIVSYKYTKTIGI